MATSVEKMLDYGQFQIAPSSSEVFGGGYSFSEAQQLRQVVLHVYKHGAFGGTERVRPLLYLDRARTKLYATGDWFSFSEITGLTTYWRGRIGLDFSEKPWIDSGKSYYLALETDGYNRNDLTTFLGYMIDYPYSINDVSAGYGLAVEFYGYRSKDLAEI